MYTLSEVEFSGLPIEIDKGRCLFLDEVPNLLAYDFVAYLRVKLDEQYYYLPLYDKRGD